MAVINILDKQTAELIAAGEVVERPSSVVKELVENSIDAGAKNILVDIERGGIKKILVQDDGSGIDSEYVKTAFIRHATSKISNKDDLDNIASLGFRGEALASIASVSHLTLITKTEMQDFAIEIQLSGGVETSFEVKPFVTGSRFIIRDLFYNTPARMKFLKKDATEAGYIQDILTNLALSKPDISFTYVKDGKEIFHTIGDGNLLNTIASLFSTEFANSLTEVDYSDDKYKITGYVTQPHSSRQSRNMQFSFINSRFVKNKTVIAAAENAYKGSVMVGKFPGYVLNIKMPYDAVDVNVHPAKTEVRFANEGEMFSTVYRAVKMAISTDVTLKQFSFKQKTAFDVEENSVKQQSFTDVKAVIAEKKEEKAVYDSFSLPFSVKNQEKADKYVEKYIVPQMQASENAKDEEYFESTSYIPYSTSASSKPPVKYHNYENNNVTQAQESDFDIFTPFDLQLQQNKTAEVDFIFAAEEHINVLGEVFSTYILCQVGDEMIVIDKHAAHERILYEKLKRNIKTGKQMLLVPVTVKLSAEEKLAVMDNISLLEDQGFEIDEFGENGVIVRGIPMYITSEDPARLVSEIAFNLASGNKAEISEKLEWIFHSVACRSAIKAGDKAEINQLVQLVRDIRSEKIPLYCPHGRPVIISISKKELEKQFGR
ncbi:MAG: DNA mismatch repair endonuclease MutL [Ruminococcaceae bacterium]|nr:DNA mismatch repair endonuclease MutL [Oscillospiraceae bacterium]